MTEHVVLDASAVLAYLQDENGSDKVHEILSEGKGMLSAVNYAEVVGKLLEAGMAEGTVKTALELLDLHIEPLDDEQAWQAGVLRTATRALGLSLGDRACLALAQVKKLPVITADRHWEKLTTGLTITQLR